MIYTIENKNLKVSISSLGAEVFSVIHKKTNAEMIWQGDKKYWTGHSPILFPFVGRLLNQTYSYNNKTYKIDKHGFARHTEFKLLSKKNDQISLYITSTSETKKVYPFKFKLIVTYKLSKDTLFFNYKIENLDNKTMYFSLGGHPAFNVPINSKGEFEDYFLQFTRNEYKQRTFTDKALYSGKTVTYKMPYKKLNLHHNLFDNDAICLAIPRRKDEVILKSKVSKDFIKVSFDNMTDLGLWHTNCTDAPFLCIEPWNGFPGLEKENEKLETKFEVTKLEKGKKYNNSFSVEFHIE